MKIKIQVTSKHIEKAKALRYRRRREKCCPVALAAQEAGLTAAHVADDGSIVFEKDGVQKLVFPKSDDVKDFVTDFDEDLDVKPFSFDLDPKRFWTRPVLSKKKKKASDYAGADSL
jgi:hypothetical protein